ncbi:hypothetical protein [Pyrobaculum aerophilum]|uniref:VapB-type antitoxin n=1 Tax=Pyrobaculum aerophilum TaxID=13773 RepID=A0A371R227_9CREN|nr:hypothetical protein [Pyrobaculum aerophilum]RFA97609.1 hypothetical protein CGL52_08725 [Pyrobaculum aerophilum]RFA98046.1 hypothetical protein CGL51_01470 [Pyrobaculum aerophilum]
MEKTTIAVSKKLWQELLSEKERLGAKTMEEAISKILQEYRESKRRIAILEIIEKNRAEGFTTVEELLEDRKRWGLPREHS